MKNVIADLNKAGIKIIDRRGKANGGNPRQRNLNNINKAAAHWTATARSGEVEVIEGHERYWKGTLGWNMGGYHIFVPRTGTAILNYDFETQTNGVGNQNSYTVHTSYEANPANPMTAAQRKTLKIIFNAIPKDVPNVKSMDNVWGHREFPGHSRNQCPGIDMTAFRKFLKDGSVPNVSPSPAPNLPGDPEPTPSPKPSTPPKLAVNGTFFGNTALIAALQRHFKTPVTGAISDPPAKSLLIEAMQRFYGSTPVTGNVSRGDNESNLFRAMQNYHGTEVTGKISNTNSMLIKKVQEQLNAGTYPKRASSGTVAPKPAAKPATPKPANNLSVNGTFFGNTATIRALQTHYKTSVTGAVSDPPATSELIRAMQRFYGTPQTGQVSRGNNKSLLWEAMQKYHKTPVTGRISASGSELFKVVQRQLNNGTYPKRG